MKRPAVGALAFLLIVLADVSHAGTLETLGLHGKLPLVFEANQGQTDAEVKFLSRGRGYGLFLTSGEAVLVLRAGAERVIRMRAVGAHADPVVAGLDEQPGRSHYLVGRDSARWRTHVRTFGRVRYGDVYPGIDLVYHGTQGHLEYDFVVRPGAQPDRIVLEFAGADRLEIDQQGDLILYTAAGAIRQRKPVIYQDVDGVRREIAGGYVLDGPRRVRFRLAAYDVARELTIDPVLVYSTFLGGGDNDRSFGVAVDAGGNVYVTGQAVSSNFPTTAGSVDPSHNGGSDAFVTKLSADGSALVFSTYLGGSGTDQGSGIVVDAAGNVYLAGTSSSADFPTTAGALDTTYNGGTSDAFVAKLDATGSVLTYATFLGGAGVDQAFGLALHLSGHVSVTGRTTSADFPATAGAFDTSLGGTEDAFVAKLDPAGAALVYATYLGGDDDGLPGGLELGCGIRVDASGTYVAGDTGSTNFPTTAGAFDATYNGGAGSFGDLFVTKLDPSGAALLYSTYLGGSASDSCQGMTVDSAGHVYVAGSTSSSDFPTTPGAFDTTFNGTILDAFVAKLGPTGATLVYSTYLGGTGNDANARVAVDAAGNAYVTGETGSFDFPITSNAVQPFFGGALDAFVVKLNPGGSTLLFSTYLGGVGFDAGNAITVDAARNVYVTGRTASANFVTTAGAFDRTYNGGISDVFVVKLATSPAEQLDELATVIDDFGLPGGIANSLLAKVQAAASALARGNTTAACNDLQALANQTQAQAGQALTAEQAEEILAAIESIRVSIGCP